MCPHSGQKEVVIILLLELVVQVRLLLLWQGFLNNLNKITISATVMNDDDRLSYLPVSRCVDVTKHQSPKKTISDPKAVAAESGVLLSKPKAPSLFTMRILVRSTSGNWDIRDVKCQIWGEALRKDVHHCHYKPPPSSRPMPRPRP